MTIEHLENIINDSLRADSIVTFTFTI